MTSVRLRKTGKMIVKGKTILSLVVQERVRVRLRIRQESDTIDQERTMKGLVLNEMDRFRLRKTGKG